MTMQNFKITVQTLLDSVFQAYDKATATVQMYEKDFTMVRQIVNDIDVKDTKGTIEKVGQLRNYLLLDQYPIVQDPPPPPPKSALKELGVSGVAKGFKSKKKLVEKTLAVVPEVKSNKVVSNEKK